MTRTGDLLGNRTYLLAEQVRKIRRSFGQVLEPGSSPSNS
jgi:hypothetical protein